MRKLKFSKRSEKHGYLNLFCTGRDLFSGNIILQVYRVNFTLLYDTLFLYQYEVN